MESHRCDLDPSYSIKVALYRNVKNNQELKQLAIDGKVSATLINPSLVVDRFQVLTAATLAIFRLKHQKLATKNIHSEILYSLSPNKQISQAFSKFGVSENYNQLLIVEVSNGESLFDELAKNVQGDLVDLDGLSENESSAEVLKFYKIKEEELKISSLVDAVVSRMTSKDFVKF